ncbi:MAG: tripartite tricarboxylate transporter substrate binding protein [Betaproteobacteria bacterium]|nr:tripartite tricarboxylate transporter substrate binding protein [Betaproteobacteria bacterium]
MIVKSCAAALAVLAVHAFPAQAQGPAPGFPSKQILFIVTSPPGGSNDTFARAIGKKLGEALGKPVVVENRPGATGSIGEAFVAKAPPDGHTIVMISSTYTTKSAIATNLPFDPLKAFAPVAMVGKGPMILAVSPGLPVKTPDEFFALAKSKPGKLNYATSGTGSINHFATELLDDAAGIQMTHVPYKGMGPATTDLMAGHVDVLIASAPSMLAQVKGGKVKGIGVTTLKASPIAPGLPPLAGAGASGYNVELWWGVLAPAGTPKEVVARLNAEINKALATDEMRDFLAREGAQAAPMTPEGFAEVIRNDIERWKKVAKAADIKAD